MKRVGLTNFVLWAIGPLVFGTIFGTDMEAVVVTGACALAIAWWTRFWPEGLGVAAGLSLECFLVGLSRSGNDAPSTLFFVIAGALFAATLVMWRVRLAAYIAVHAADEPAARTNGTSRPLRLIAGVVVAACTLFVVNVVFYAGYWFANCGGDTTPPPPPGSDLERYCDLTGSGTLAALLVFGPSILVLCAGVATAFLRRARLVLVVTLAGVGLTIALHVPGWVVPAGG